jgi:signal transduction histidine kinase
LVQAIGPAAIVAIDNERLQAELLAQLAELRSSQVRIVQTGDAERRRLERNLHDAAQQRVLALSYGVGLALTAARKSARRDVPELLQRAMRTVQSTVDELRQLAHGIYPAVLTESGLRPALLSLADLSSVRVEIGTVESARLPAIVERTAYLAAADIIHQAGSAGVDELTIAAVRAGDDLVVEIRPADVTPTSSLSDRLGALGGKTLQTEEALRVEIPCG